MVFRNGPGVGKRTNGHPITSNGSHASSNGSSIAGSSKRVRFAVVEAPET